MWDPQHLRALQVFTACYEDSFTCLCADDVRTSQETPPNLHGLLRGQRYLFPCIIEIRYVSAVWRPPAKLQVAMRAASHEISIKTTGWLTLLQLGGIKGKVHHTEVDGR
jgi:hypothetical protein